MNDRIDIAALIIIATTFIHPSAATADDWQEKMLFDPSAAQLAVEHKQDRIMIYNGMKDTRVSQAMNEQFDRIEHMMFTGTVVTDSNGATVIDPATGMAQVEDDGCD